MNFIRNFAALLISILPVYMKENLALSAFIIGLTLALQYIGDNLFRSLIGWVIDRIGYRPSMLTGVILTFTAVAIIANLTHFLWIITTCTLLGSMLSGKLWDMLGYHAPFIASGLVLVCL